MNFNIRTAASGPILTGKAPQVVQQNLDLFITKATLFLDAEVKRRTPQGVYGAQGGLIGSIQHDITGKGTPLVKGRVLSSHAYVEPIEKGRRPGKGMPPKGSLTRWIEVKLGMSATQAQRIEFVIRRKIGVKGFEGRFMFEKSVTENQSRLDAMAEECGLNIVGGLNGQ